MSEEWLVIDDIIKSFNSFYFDDAMPSGKFVQSNQHAIDELCSQRFDVLSIDYNLNFVGGGTTEPLVEWLTQPDQVARFAGQMVVNVHSTHPRASSLVDTLTAAGYTVTSQRI